MKVRYFASLGQALELLGIAWAEASQLVAVSDEVPIAAWGHYADGNEDVVMVNPRILRWPPPVIATILKHELLHYASYGRAYTFLEDDESCVHDELANLVLDVVINRILWTSDEGEFNATRRRVYAGVPADSPIALAAGPPEKVVVSPDLADLQQYVWGRKEVPSPYLLYVRLLRKGVAQVVSWTGGFGGFPGGGRGEDGGKREEGRDKGEGRRGPFLARRPAGGKPDPQSTVGQGGRKAIEAVAARGWGRSQLPFTSDFVRGIKSLDIGAVKRLLESIVPQRMIAQAAKTILDHEDKITERAFYTLHPTMTTAVLLAAGIAPDLWPFLRERKRGARRKSMGVYVDTSGSLYPWRAQEMRMVDLLREYFPTRLFVFADEVAEIDRDRFAAGDYPQGAGTSFEAMLKHFGQQLEEIAVVFTDGISSCSPEWGTRLTVAGKRLYVVYLALRGTQAEQIRSPLDAFASGRAVLWL